MTKNKISIIIPCYNDHLYLEEAVQSASAQTWENKEIILVDDGSNVETKNVIKSLEYLVDILITQENQGVSAARNNGIKAATGDYILVLDSDDYFDSSFCEKAINNFQTKNEIVLITCYTRWFEETGQFKIFKPLGGKIPHLLFNNIAMGSSIFKKRDWKKVNGYDEQMNLGYEDWEYYIRLHKDGGETYVIPEVLFHYRKKETSRNAIANKHKYELLEYIYLKHADLYKENFEIFVKKILHSLAMEETKNKKIFRSREYEAGKFIVGPAKKLKLFLRELFSN